MISELILRAGGVLILRGQLRDICKILQSILISETHVTVDRHDNAPGKGRELSCFALFQTTGTDRQQDSRVDVVIDLVVLALV